MSEASSTGAVVIVIDLQVGMFTDPSMGPLHEADALVERVRTVLAWARRTGRSVGFIRHDGATGDLLAPGEAGWPVLPALGQAQGEPTFSKSVGDAFSNPALIDWLEGQGADEVILLGAQTDQCVAATNKGALARGLKVIVVGDAHSTWDWAGETAAQIIARHNAAFVADGARVTSTAALTGG